MHKLSKTQSSHYVASPAQKTSSNYNLNQKRKNLILNFFKVRANCLKSWRKESLVANPLDNFKPRPAVGQ